jgi:carbamoyltransferase
VLLNTSFNTANEPIVRTPSDAVRCLRETDLDLVALEGCVVRKPAVRAR